MQSFGYPSYVLLLILLAGGWFALFRPYWAFLFAVVLFSIPMVYDAVNTRTINLGPYFNLYDALFVVALAAVIMDPHSRPLALPRPVGWILLVLGLGVFQVAWSYEVNWLVLRAIRWSITFPLAFFLGANFVVNRSRAKLFFFALIAGSVLAALRSFIDYRIVFLAEQGSGAVRLDTAGAGLGTSFLAAVTQQSFFPHNSLLIKGFWVAALMLFAMTILFGQWRSVYLAVLLSVMALPFVLNRWRNMGRTTLITLVGIPLLLLTFHLMLPTVDPTGFLKRFTPLLEYQDTNERPHVEDQTRIRQIKREFEEWTKGNWVWGRGLSFVVFLPDAEDLTIAWGHVGYISYLANLGLLGLFVLGVYLPVRIFQAAKLLYWWKPHDPVGLLGITAIATVLQVTIMSFMSMSYLSPLSYTVGFLYGAVWTLAYGKSPAYNLIAAATDYHILQRRQYPLRDIRNLPPQSLNNLRNKRHSTFKTAREQKPQEIDS